MSEDQNPPNPNGRPPIEIDFDKLNKLIKIHATYEEIAFFFGCSHETIVRRIKEKTGMTFAEYYRSVSVGGRLSLRRKAWQLALEKDNSAMLSLLLKQNEKHGGLGFSEKVVQENYDGKGEYEKMMGIVTELEERKRKESQEDDGN